MICHLTNKPNILIKFNNFKLKAASQEEKFPEWKEHFKNLFENPPEITEKSIQKIVDGQQDIKLKQFMEEELYAVLKKIKNRKSANLNEIPPDVCKTRNILLWLYNAIYKQNSIEKWAKSCIFPFTKKGDLKILYNYRSITLIVIAAKVYNVLFFNCIQLEIEKILKKNQNDFDGIAPPHWFWQSIKSLKKYEQRISRQHYSS